MVVCFYSYFWNFKRGSVDLMYYDSNYEFCDQVVNQ